MRLENKRLEDLDLMTEENRQHFVKLIFFKKHKSDSRWHITLPELTTLEGFVGFCGLISWSELDTQNRQRLFALMDQEKSQLCERCSEEFVLAEPALKALGYLSWKE